MTTANTNLELAQMYHKSPLTFNQLAKELNIDEDLLSHKVTLGDMESDALKGIDPDEVDDIHWECNDLYPEVAYN